MSHFRVLHLRASNFVGGPEQQLLRYAQSESGGSWEVHLGSFVGGVEGSDFLRTAEARGLHTLALPTRNLGPNSALSKLIEGLRSRKIDLLCTHGFKADVLGIIAARLSRVPVACFLRGWTRENRKVRFYEGADRFSLHLASRVVCLSDSQAKKLSKWSFLAGKIRVVGNAIDVPAVGAGRRNEAREEVRRRFGLPQSCRVIATAGRLSPEKGVSDFIEACSALGPRFHEARFLIFGEGVLRQALERQVHTLGIQDRVMFVGFAPDLRGLLPGIDILVNPSHSEEMPNIVLEGMAAGIPVIATAVGGVEEIAGPEHSIGLVPPAKPEILANTIAEMLQEPAGASRLAQMGRMRVEQVYSLANQRSQFHALYEEFLPCAQSVSPSRARNRGIAEETPGSQPVIARTPDTMPFLTVVIPVRNEEAHIEAVLGELNAQDYPHDRFEVMVADGDSTDGTAKVVEGFAPRTSLSVRLLRNAARLSSAGRNVGARNARGQYIIFIDGHCEIRNRSLLKDAVELFERTAADCLCRPQPLTLSANNPFQDVVAHVRATSLGHGRDSTIYATSSEGFVNPSSSGALYRRSVFERIGYYDERFDACEDVEFNYRVLKAGLSSYLSSRLTIFYQPRANISGLWRQMVRYGRGRFLLIRKHPGAFSFSQIIPAGLLVGLVGGLFASLLSVRFFPYYLVGLTIYLTVVLGFSIALGLRYGWRHLLQAPCVYFVIHFGLAMGFLAELLITIPGTGRRSERAADPDRPLQASATENRLSGAKPDPRGGGFLVVDQHPTAICPEVLNSMTVDVEDYFHTEAMSKAVAHDQWTRLPSHVERNTHVLFELFAAHNVRGTFFFLGWVAERFPGLVREAAELGHELACHSYWHRVVYRLTPEQFREDTKQAKQVIEDAAGAQVLGYRAPNFSFVKGTEWAPEILANLGFRYDSSVYPVRHDIYNNPDAPRIPTSIAGGTLMEFPVATLAFGDRNLPVGGGGYLRILPYGYTHWGLSRLNRVRVPAVVYIHPWEIDPGQPRIAASARSRFRQYTGLRTTAGKLDRMLKDFRFAPINEVFAAELASASHPAQPGPAKNDDRVMRIPLRQ